MSWRATWVCCLVMVVGCTQRNPEYCGDGTCIDPAKPFCDIDGSFAGTAGTCVAVSCTAGEFAKCRDDIAITCNATGTNYDLVRCEMGCDPDASGCKECTTNAQCNASDVCDTDTNHCRGCSADDECDSRVCDMPTGRCVAEDSVLYASPNGTGTCSRTQPCALTKAFAQAATSTPLRIVRMLPGNYAMPLKADVLTAEPVQIVATGANMIVIGDTAAIVVNAGAKLEIRNLTATSERLVQCGLASMYDPISSVRMQDSMLTVVGGGLGFEIQRCLLDLNQVDVSTTGSVVVAIRNDSVFSADRLYVRAQELQASSIVLGGARVSVDVANSVLDQVDIASFASDTGPPGTSVRLSHTTMLLPSTADLCNSAPNAYVSLAIENSILATRGPGDVLESSAACTFVSTLLSRQASPPAGTTVADPKFVDLAAHDFHLSSESPAIDAASMGTTVTDHDLEGTPRPQGAKADLGAYEYRP